MKVYLIKTPEYKNENLEEIQEMLSSFNGPLEFIADDYEFNPVQFPFLKELGEDFRIPTYESDPLRWSDLFSLCKFYRNTFKIEEHDFVVLLTSRKNDLNWFSHYDENKNIFVHTGDWEDYIKAPQKFPVAYQVVENVMQHLMKLDTEKIPNPCIHAEPIGCMNDFCQNKKDVILKLRTGDICHDCLSKMEEENVDDEIVNQAIGIFEVIRNQLLFKQGFTRKQNPKRIRIDNEGKIFIGKRKIKLNPLESTLFIFFIVHQDGVSLNDLEMYRETLLNIYRILRPSGEGSKIDMLIKPKGTGTFPKNKCSLNKKLKEQIGEPLVNFYYLNRNSEGAFKINITANYITSDIRY